LPGTGVCTQISDLEARPWNGSARSGAVVRFALCQQSIKFDPADDALLVQIAKRVGSCEFWLVIPEKLGWTAVKLRDRLARAFRAGGLDPADFLRLTPWLSSGQFLGFLDAMDISLDSPAFSGYTTAWQAVHRGLPIVTLEGRYLRQRLASGVLRQIGMEDQIARSREEYVEIAARLAHERLYDARSAAARRAAIRQAAHKSDHNVAAIRAFETAVIQLKRAKHRSAERTV
jgi:protein O-GlcNAc transferase